MRVTKEDLLKENDELRGRLFEAQTELIRQKTLVQALTANNHGGALNTLAMTVQRMAEASSKLSDAAVEMDRSRR